ncbi:hypothetical protein [Parafrankia sp. BMG5.11]|uniref:DUF6998 domain-containing protein n=1 Tax=Parafrankia sp. BMG5.11 TaxID=222540 RepID=UPI00103FB4FF|nr:hypothetical protein [Parafrankia sp. BMG5.11]TCJ37248.1 hypothetical protein E0504_19520 [Parafrankia sp. BMG5.11]
MKFELPPSIQKLIAARNELKAHYSAVDLHFTLDGNLVGDLGEAVAAELFGLRLTGRSNEGIDGYAPDGRSVQGKASGTKRGAAFRPVETHADHLLFFHFDYDGCYGEVIYNGPEQPIRELLPSTWVNQRPVSAPALRRLNQLVADADRLPLTSKAN